MALTACVIAYRWTIESPRSQTKIVPSMFQGGPALTEILLESVLLPIIPCSSFKSSMFAVCVTVNVWPDWQGRRSGWRRQVPARRGSSPFLRVRRSNEGSCAQGGDRSQDHGFRQYGCTTFRLAPARHRATRCESVTLATGAGVQHKPSTLGQMRVQPRGQDGHASDGAGARDGRPAAQVVARMSRASGLLRHVVREECQLPRIGAVMSWARRRD
jgi:hypothetical protein